MLPVILLLTLMPLSPVLGRTFAHGCTLEKPVDLSRPLSDESAYSYAPFKTGKLTDRKIDGVRYHTGEFCMGDHVGTHLDTPFYLNEGGMSAAQIPLENLITNGLFFDVSEEVDDNPDFVLEASHIEKFFSSLKSVSQNVVLLISYGWAKHYGSKKYLGTTSDGNASDRKYPGMSVEAAQSLAKIKELVGVGTDAPSIDPPNKMKSHAILMAKNIYTIEQVAIDQATCLPDSGFKLIIMPLKLSLGTGAPARVIATPDTSQNDSD